MKTILWDPERIDCPRHYPRAPRKAAAKDIECKASGLVQRQCVDPERGRHRAGRAMLPPAPIPGASTPMAPLRCGPATATSASSCGPTLARHLVHQGVAGWRRCNRPGCAGPSAGGRWCVAENSYPRLSHLGTSSVGSDVQVERHHGNQYGRQSVSLRGRARIHGLLRRNYYFSVSPSLTRVRFEATDSRAIRNVLRLRAPLKGIGGAGDSLGVSESSPSIHELQTRIAVECPTWSSWSGTLAFTATYN